VVEEMEVGRMGSEVLARAIHAGAGVRWSRRWRKDNGGECGDVSSRMG
jgi:hypothetical protein